MKYTIMGFQQTKLIENKLTIEDAFILRVIKDMYSSTTMEFITDSNIKYMWVNYTYLFSQIPIVGTKRNLMRRVERYGVELFLLRLLKFERKGVKGKFSYISPTKKLDELLDYDYDLMTKSHKGYDKIAQGLGQNRITLMTKSHIKDTSIKDTSIKDNNTSIDDFFEKIWQLYPRKKGKSEISNTKKKELYKIGFEKMKQSIENYKKEIKANNTEDKFIKHGSSFFNTNYKDYLPENYESCKENINCSGKYKEVYFDEAGNKIYV